MSGPSYSSSSSSYSSFSSSSSASSELEMLITSSSSSSVLESSDPIHSPPPSASSSSEPPLPRLVEGQLSLRDNPVAIVLIFIAVLDDSPVLSSPLLAGVRFLWYEFCLFVLLRLCFLDLFLLICFQLNVQACAFVASASSSLLLPLRSDLPDECPAFFF